MSFRTHYLGRLKQIGTLSYAEFEDLHDMLLVSLDESEFSKPELSLLDDVKDQFIMTVNGALGGEDRELGLITWPEFQRYVQAEIIPGFGV
ncbi:hypothetical protein IZ6_20720 [Terrihabitans soli]|uniref:Uncharacterized protein n=1 Tax=Terrihabitans soli TaxID=708113 RepID=A0A6S6QTR7_9HYPH|nr:hypothetical protein [Terrihabitans soli]BCJ91337.1 hypothetical protein IZ6_20720 [Terrihabitans soli]